MSYDVSKSMDIGLRATREILKASRVNRSTITSELESLDVSRQQFYKWERGCAPSALILARMADAGYDVMYILTGRACV